MHKRVFPLSSTTKIHHLNYVHVDIAYSHDQTVYVKVLREKF